MHYFLYIFTGSICSCFSCINLLPVKIGALKVSLIYLYTFITLYFLFISMGQFGTFFLLAGLLLLLYFFTKKSYFSLSCALFGYLYTVTANYIFMWAAQLVLNMDMEKMLSDKWLTSIFSCIYCFFCVTTTKLLGNYFHRKLRISKYFSNTTLSASVFLNLLLLSIFFVFNFSYGEYLGYDYEIIMLNGVTFLLLFILTAYLLQYIYCFAAREQFEKNRIEQFENLQVYTNSLEKSYGFMRKFKHDYINILSTLYEYIKEEDLENLRSFFSEKILPISFSFTETDTKLSLLSYIKNPALKGLVSSKIIYAVEIGISVKVELTEDIENLSIEILDISRVLGIFLDNAIEAARETIEKELCLCLFYKEKNLYIIVRNTASPPIFPIAELTNHTLSSKGSDRGLGLYQALTILNHYPDVIWNTNFQKPYFTQELIIPTNEKEK